MHTGCFEGPNPAGEVVSVVERVDPKEVLVGERKPGVLKPHEGNVVDKGEISGKPLAGLAQSWGGDRMQDQPDFDPGDKPKK